MSFARRLVHRSSLQLTQMWNARAEPPGAQMSPLEVEQFIGSFDTVLTDCDGVLWIDDAEISGASKTMNAFRRLGKRVFFVTNNSTKHRKDFLIKATDMGFEAQKEDILSTAFLAAEYLKSVNFTKKVYIIGSKGITDELDEAGIKWIGPGPDPLVSLPNLITQFKPDPEVGAVVVGFDEHFSYPKMLKAATYLDRPDCIFIGTNTDERFPKRGFIVPGTGSFVRCIETCAERKSFVVGKPEKYVCEAIVKGFGVDPARTLMIGDRANTDILLGTRCGFKTLLVLSGVTKLEEVHQWRKSNKKEEQDLVPDVYANSIGDILPFLSS